LALLDLSADTITIDWPPSSHLVLVYQGAYQLLQKGGTEASAAANLRRIADEERSTLLDDLRRRLQRGDLVATARERPTGPRIAVAAEAWQYLYPHFADDTARDGLGAVVLFQVRIAEAAPPQASLAQDAIPPAVTVHADPKPVYSLSTLRAWYLLRRSSWPATEQPPSEADDLAAASQHFGVKVSRDPFRAIRREMAPAAWKKSGPRKPPKQ
jgi:hypothetical protein